MARRCIVTNKGPMSGNNVSHANNKTKRRYLPNLQTASFYSGTLKKSFRFRLSTTAIKTIDFKGGLDTWLSQEKSSDLSNTLRKLKRLIETHKTEIHKTAQS